MKYIKRKDRCTPDKLVTFLLLHGYMRDCWGQYKKTVVDKDGVEHTYRWQIRKASFNKAEFEGYHPNPTKHGKQLCKWRKLYTGRWTSTWFNANDELEGMKPSKNLGNQSGTQNSMR